jgi:hypothetical protein
MELLQVNQESYPIMYRIYWSPDLDVTRQIETNREHNTVLATIYNTYYNLTLDLNSLDDITYVGRVNPWCIIFKVVYLNTDGTLDYIWEYYDNWVKILNLNRY